MVCPNSAAQLVPEVLYRVQVRRACWPLQAVDLLLLEELIDNPGSVRPGIIILENGASAHGLQSGDDDGLQNVVPVAVAGQVALNSVERCSVGPPHSTPHHDGPSTVSVALPNCGVVVALAFPSPDSNSAVMEGPREARFIRKEDSGPLLSGLPHMSPGPGQAGHSVGRSQDWSYCWTSGAEVRFPQAVPYCLV